MKPNPENVNEVFNYPKPESIKDFQKFIGLASYYRIFLNSFGDLSQPLHKLTNNSVGFDWSVEADILFETNKSRLTSCLVLSNPAISKHFKVSTDARSYAIGAILEQEGHPIIFASRVINKAKSNYSAYDLDMVFDLKTFRQYLLGKNLVCTLIMNR
ncbi:Retrovirus-related Pol polyprotein from transposon 17.6 [Thelohanellus kitauei]|uniref:Retrovirus-related Pol polyprotein from transposon 17.6 n=1 Tax=Thelohanellus kitauei TaxID=669202 RepID=A0A0C2MA49_THEKT|nr:Retrovirus-related Pol polyprotein from transposon 17.6 [Thelohanellus kitauei]